MPVRKQGKLIHSFVWNAAICFDLICYLLILSVWLAVQQSQDGLPSPLSGEKKETHVDLEQNPCTYVC